jgi:hypothetical protein
MFLVKNNKNYSHSTNYCACRNVNSTSHMFSCFYLDAGLYGRLLNFYGDSFFGLDKSLFEKLYAPPIAFFTIAGISQILINLAYFALLW